ncbi:MAG: YigZ family protein [Ignavibacteriaceae bacterium]|nr:YigZ family protein [Ignavibacteriaceae bacterium]
MTAKEEIKTIASHSETKFKEKGSLFIGKAFSVETEDDFSSELLKLKKDYYDASHLCFAYKLKDDTFKYSDAGEPGGTAGIRIYNAIEHFSVVDIGVVVIRYFGGTKLGVGPLGKAYYKSAEYVIACSTLITKKAYKKVIIKTGFQFISSVHHYLPLFDAIISDVQYSNDVIFVIELFPSQIKKLKEVLTEACSGNIELKVEDNTFFR